MPTDQFKEFKAVAFGKRGMQAFFPELFDSLNYVHI